MEGSSSFGWGCGTPTRPGGRSSLPNKGKATRSGTGNTNTNGNGGPSNSGSNVPPDLSQLNLETYISPEFREFHRTFLARLTDYKAKDSEINKVIGAAEDSEFVYHLADSVKDVFVNEWSTLEDAIRKLKEDFLRLFDEEVKDILGY